MRVKWRLKGLLKFQRYSGIAPETVKTVSTVHLVAHTGLKPGVNENQELRSFPVLPDPFTRGALRIMFGLTRNDAIESGEHTPLACGLRRLAANFV